MFHWVLYRFWAIMSEAYLEPSQKSMVEHFAKIVKKVTSTTKLFCHKVTLDVQLMNFFI